MIKFFSELDETFIFLYSELFSSQRRQPKGKPCKGDTPGMHTGCCYTVMELWAVLRVTAIKQGVAGNGSHKSPNWRTGDPAYSKPLCLLDSPDTFRVCAALTVNSGLQRAAT